MRDVDWHGFAWRLAYSLLTIALGYLVRAVERWYKGAAGKGPPPDEGAS